MSVRKKKPTVSRIKSSPKINRRDPELIAIGQRIRAARRAKGLSQTELGDLLGITNVTVFRHEKGVVRPSTPVLQGYAAQLGVTLDQLMGGPPSDVRPTAEAQPTSQPSSADIPRTAARIIGIVPNVSDAELDYVSKLFRSDPKLTLETLELLLLARRVSESRTPDTLVALNEAGARLVGAAKRSHRR